MPAVRTTLPACVAAVALATVGLAVPTTAAPMPGDVLAEGLAGPLGLAVDPQGNVYVAQSFGGGLVKITPGGVQSTVYAPDGVSVNGVDIARSRILVTQATLGATEEDPPTDTALATLTRQGAPVKETSLLAYEVANNPDADQEYGFETIPDDCAAQLPPFLPPTFPGDVNSNPYKVAALPGNGALVADAGANALLKVMPNGKISTVAVLPPVPQLVGAEIAAELGLPECVVGLTFNGNFVPTDIEIAPDGTYWVSSLPGIPEAPGAGSVWTIDPHSGDATLVTDGFVGSVDLAIAPNGTVYVAELFGGRVSKIAKNGDLKTVAELDMPGAVEVGKDGTVYATTGVFNPAGGSVVVLKVK